MALCDECGRRFLNVMFRRRCPSCGGMPLRPAAWIPNNRKDAVFDGAAAALLLDAQPAETREPLSASERWASCGSHNDGSTFGGGGGFDSGSFDAGCSGGSGSGD